MALRNVLGGLLKYGGPIAASFIPGVGPAVGAAMGAAGGLTDRLKQAAPGLLRGLGERLTVAGPIAGAAAGGAATGRQAEADILFRQRQLQQQQALAGQRAAEAGAEFGLGQQQDRLLYPSLFARQAAQGGMQANVQDIGIGRPEGSTIPTFALTGGLRPSALGPEARQAGAELSRHAIQQLLAGGPPPIDYERFQPLEPMTLPEAGRGERLLGGLGVGGSLLGALLGPLSEAAGTQNVPEASPLIASSFMPETGRPRNIWGGPPRPPLFTPSNPVGR
jgi:hypothetical protein